MLHKYLSAGLITLFTVTAFAQTPWQSALVKVDDAGLITYEKDADGFVIPDFSHAGYRGGEPVPDYRPSAARIETVTPIADADNTARIQQAIDKIAALAPDADGFRGVVLLSAGKYLVDGQINLNASGVVLRGAGRGRDITTDQLTDTDLQSMTLIYRRGTGGGLAANVVVMGPGNASSATWGNSTSNETDKVNITTTKVMPGDYSFEVQTAVGYSVGDAVCIKYPTTEAFLEAIWYGGNSNWVNGGDAGSKWTTSEINLCYHRYIAKIDGNTITLDAPVFYCLDKKYSQAYMHKITTGTVYTNIGIENLRISMDRTPASITATPDQNCIKMNALENCWAKGLHLSDFVHGGIKTEAVTRSTIEDCRAVDCSGYITGSNQYNFESYHRSQLILIQGCLSRNGRHHWLSNGAASTSGIVVLNHTSTLANAATEGHRLFTQGILIDGWKESGWTFSNNRGLIGFYLRDNMGTHHGWGAVFSVLWNCDVQNGAVYLDKVPTGQNYSIGSTANTVRKYRSSDAKYTVGYNEGQNKPGLYPKSLYEAQLNARRSQFNFSITEHPKAVTTCINKSVSLSVAAQAPNVYTITYRWKKDGTPIEGATQKTLTINRATQADAGIYTVEVSYYGETLESEPAEVTLYDPLPELKFAGLQESVRTLNTYRIEVVDAASGTPTDATGYQWEYSGMGVSFDPPTGNPVNITVSADATDGVLQVNISHPCGMKILSENITVEKTTGYTDSEASDARIFPNPANDKVYIQNIRTVKHIEIINASGQTVYSRPVEKDCNELVVPLSGFNAGMYVVHIRFGPGERKSYKLVKK